MSFNLKGSCSRLGGMGFWRATGMISRHPVFIKVQPFKIVVVGLRGVRGSWRKGKRGVWWAKDNNSRTGLCDPLARVIEGTFTADLT